MRILPARRAFLLGVVIIGCVGIGITASTFYRQARPSPARPSAKTPSAPQAPMPGARVETPIGAELCARANRFLASRGHGAIVISAGTAIPIANGYLLKCTAVGPDNRGYYIEILASKDYAEMAVLVIVDARERGKPH